MAGGLGEEIAIENGGIAIGTGEAGFFAGEDGFFELGTDFAQLNMRCCPGDGFELSGVHAGGTWPGVATEGSAVRMGQFDEAVNFLRGFRLDGLGAALENGGSSFELGNDGMLRLRRGPKVTMLGYGVEGDNDNFTINGGGDEIKLDAQAFHVIGGEGGGTLSINRDASFAIGGFKNAPGFVGFRSDAAGRLFADGSSFHARVMSPAGPNGFDIEDHGMAKFGNGNGGITIHSDGAFEIANPLARFLIDSAGRFEMFTFNDAGRRNGLKTIHTGNVLLGQFENDGNFRSGLDVDVAGNGTYRGPSFHVDGVFSTTGPKPFRIPHPLQPARELWHAAIEAPQPMNVYSGNVRTDGHGLAVVRLPAYFDEVNRDFRYQLTPIGTFARAIIAKEIARNRFTVRTDKPNVKVSWQVTAVRDDAYMRSHPFRTERARAR